MPHARAYTRVVVCAKRTQARAKGVQRRAQRRAHEGFATMVRFVTESCNGEPPTSGRTACPKALRRWRSGNTSSMVPISSRCGTYDSPANLQPAASLGAAFVWTRGRATVPWCHCWVAFPRYPPGRTDVCSRGVHGSRARAASAGQYNSLGANTGCTCFTAVDHQADK